MKLIDTHCHIDAPEFDIDRADVINAACEKGVEKIIVPATTCRRWRNLLSICETNDSLFPALGLHPVYLAQHQLSDLELLETALDNSTIVAVGEIGLDYYLKDLSKAKQLKLLEAQLSIARQIDLPVILHCRKAYDDLIISLEKFQLKGGVVHAFNGSLQHAHKLIDLGFKLGFGGMLTYERSTRLRKLATQLPIFSIVLETDSPDLTVAQHRGERNSPAYLPFVLQTLAQVRDESIEELEDIVWRNSVQAFDI